MSKSIRLIIIALVLVSNLASAQTVYKFDGKIGGQYPIVIELEEFEDGLFAGQYAYTSPWFCS